MRSHGAHEGHLTGCGCLAGETWDQRLNVLISHSIPDIYPLIARGKYGLIGLVSLLEHLVRDRKVDKGLLDGKVGRIMEAIDRYPPLVLLPFLYSRFRFLLVSASSKMSEKYPRIPPGP